MIRGGGRRWGEMGGQQCCFVRFFSFVFNSKFSFQFKVFKHQLSLSALDYISQRRKLFLWEIPQKFDSGTELLVHDKCPRTRAHTPRFGPVARVFGKADTTLTHACRTVTQRDARLSRAINISHSSWWRERGERGWGAPQHGVHFVGFICFQFGVFSASAFTVSMPLRFSDESVVGVRCLPVTSFGSSRRRLWLERQSRQFHAAAAPQHALRDREMMCLL